MALVSQFGLPMSAREDLTNRPVLRTRQSISQPRTARSYNGRFDRGIYSARPGFTRFEVETLMREKVRDNYDSIKNAFSSYDTSGKLSISKDDFRTVMSSHCLPLTVNQFETLLTKVEKSSVGLIMYMDFLEKFSGGIGIMKLSSNLSEVSTTVRNSNQLVKDVSVENLEKMLKNKISENLKSVTKALHLFDYNRDGKIQRYELRRVLENYCFKLTDLQFDKLWQKYDVNHTGIVNYKELLNRLGFHQEKLLSTNSVQSALTWPMGLLQSDKNTDNRVRHQLRQEEQWLKKLSFDEIEQEFRKRMRNNHINLKKSFLSFDKDLTGFVNIEDMNSILTNFTIPMSNQLFSKLMERCGIKGTGRVAWELFLEKFQNPMQVGNGQTLPIRPSHKFFPIMETQSIVLADDIWNQLYKSIESHYSSFKQAFLEFDIKRTGSVTHKDFRRILERYTFELDDKQFKCIMLKLDPHHTNSVTYHQFLQIFEERDTWEGHKWLNSVHRFNEKQKPLIMAWETVEDILREKIAENWKNVSDAIMYYDHLEEGCIFSADLKRVIDKYVLPISVDHFQHLLCQCKNRWSDGKVSYVEFLEKLKVVVAPGDLNGLSSQIFAGSKLAEQIRITDNVKRQLLINQRAEDRTNFTSAEEVIIRLSDRISQHKTQLHDAFQAYDKAGKGRISKKNFRKLLHSMGFLMADEQFQDLVPKLNFQNGFMSYKNFINNFENRNGQDVDVVRSGNHHVNPIRGDEFGFVAQEVEFRLRTKLRDNFPDLRAAFYKFDDDHNGILTKSNFQRMLDSFMIVTSDEEYEILCRRLGINKHSRISYQDFLDRFEIRDTKDGHTWLNSVHRYNNTIPPRKLTAEETHKELKIKAHRQWTDLAKAFLGFDRKKNGVIKRVELKNVLNRFMITMTKEEFENLWKMYDEEDKGYVSHQDFLVKLGAAEFAPKDDGTSQHIIDKSHQNLIDHNFDQQMKHEEATLKQAEWGVQMTAEYVEQQLRDRIRDKYKDFYSAFRNYDTKKRGFLSVNEVQKVLVDLNFFLSDEEFFRLLDSLGLHTNQSRLNYEDFLRAFEEGRKSSYGTKKKEFSFSSEDNSSLSPHDAEEKLNKKIASQKYTLERACASFDKDQRGLISTSDLRSVLDMFCCKLNNKQWSHFINKFHKEGDNMITYRVFLNFFTSSGPEDSMNWLSMLKKSSLVGGSQVLTPDTPVKEVEDRLKESVAAHFHTLAKSLEEMDYAKIGVVSREDFKTILDTDIFKLTEEQFEQLWNTLPVNEFGNLDYHEFLKAYDSEYIPGYNQPNPVPRNNSAQDLESLASCSYTSLSQRSVTRSESQSSRMSRSKSRLSTCTPLVNADSAEQSLKHVIFKHWKDIQKKCRVHDQQNTGTIDGHQFKCVMLEYDVNLSSDDFQKLMTKYDLRENGRFCYADFLRHFVLDLKSRDNSSSFRRRKLQPTILEATIEVVNNQYVNNMKQITAIVTQHWKDMRRMFRAIDQKSTGVVWADDFRRILRQFNVNLTEDEFCHMISYYDKNLDDKINYNNFIKSYLQR